ncbi:MAG: PAS domain S-box protein [Lentisphaeria bacterium]|jgi:PAS domain S-box-containing protein|nr:PAS domain S-box protein [Lentisphaeria bacterium]
MTSNHRPLKDADALRRCAEEVASARQAPGREPPRTLSAQEVQRQNHELRVHQIELEMQNEELRSAQAALDVAQARYFDLYDLAPVGYCTISGQGLIQEANLTVAGLLGVPRSTLAGKPISRFILPADQDIYYRHRQQLLATGQPQVAELRMLRAAAPSFWARLESTVVGDDGASSLRVVISDIDERKRSQQVLAESERKFRALAEHSPSMILIGLGSRLVYANPHCREVLGYTEAELCATDFVLDTLSAPDSGDLFKERFQRQMTDEPCGLSECALLAKDGRRVEVMLATSRIDYEGRPATLGIITDITERRRVEDELRHQREQLRILAAVSAAEEHERQRIAAGLHDGVGQLLFAVTLKLRQIWLLTKAKPVKALLDEAKELVDRSLRETQSLSFEFGFPILHESGLAEALRDLCARMRSQYHLDFQFTADGSDQPLPDEAAIILFQAVRELLLNVVKHARASGAEVAMSMTDGKVCIAVRDDGIGCDLALAGLGTSPTGQFGLNNIRNRLDRVAGNMRFEAAASGCRIVLEVPLEPA